MSCHGGAPEGASASRREPQIVRIAPLKRRSDFLRIAARRRKWAAPGLILQVARTEPASDTPDDTDMRVGYTASRRVGGAVQRNRAKRRLRATVARVMPLHAAPGHDYVLIARTATLTRRFEDLVQDLETALERTGAALETRAENGGTVCAGGERRQRVRSDGGRQKASPRGE